MLNVSARKTALALAVAQALSATDCAAVTTFTVNSNLDLPIERSDNNCTLREAVERALDGTVNDCAPVGTGANLIAFSFTQPTTITLADYGGTINAGLMIDDDLIIQGPAGRQ